MWSRNCVNLYYSLSFLPLLIFPCTIKSRSSLLAPSHPGGPGKRAVKRLWCGCGIFLLVFSFVSRFISVYFKVCVFVYPVGHVHWVMQYWWTGKTPNAISCWVTSTVVQVFSSYLCSGMQYLPVLLYRYAMKCLDKKRIKLKGGETLALNERIMLSLVSTEVTRLKCTLFYSLLFVSMLFW